MARKHTLMKPGAVYALGVLGFIASALSMYLFLAVVL